MSVRHIIGFCLVASVAGSFFSPWATVCRGAVFPSDPIPITHWGTDEGLGPGQVLTILQTRDGYLWFGSTEGLMRFDGVRCTVFDTRNTPELRANGVLALHEDRLGKAGFGLERAAVAWPAVGRMVAL